MDSRTDVYRQTLAVCLGQLVCAVVLMGAFAAAGCYDSTVLWGSLAGTALACSNFYLMSLFAGIAAGKAQAQDVAGGQKILQLSYTGRMIALLAALVLLAKSGRCHVLALALPLAFPRPILTVYGVFRKKAVSGHGFER